MLQQPQIWHQAGLGSHASSPVSYLCDPRQVTSLSEAQILHLGEGSNLGIVERIQRAELVKPLALCPAYSESSVSESCNSNHGCCRSRKQCWVASLALLTASLIMFLVMGYEFNLKVTAFRSCCSSSTLSYLSKALHPDMVPCLCWEAEGVVPTWTETPSSCSHTSCPE